MLANLVAILSSMRRAISTPVSTCIIYTILRTLYHYYIFKDIRMGFFLYFQTVNDLREHLIWDLLPSWVTESTTLESWSVLTSPILSDVVVGTCMIYLFVMTN